MVRADLDGWQDTVQHQIDEGTNFLLLIPKQPEAIREFCRLFGLPDNCDPNRLTRPDFFRLGQYLESEAFDEVLEHWDQGTDLVFVEQIDFPVNRPPRLQPFLVYSPVLGIIAQGDSLATVKEALADYRSGWMPGMPSPEAAVYCWDKSKWHLYEGR